MKEGRVSRERARTPKSQRNKYDRKRMSLFSVEGVVKNINVEE